jgi:hypothetical protein
MMGEGKKGRFSVDKGMECEGEVGEGEKWTLGAVAGTKFTSGNTRWLHQTWESYRTTALKCGALTVR